MQIIPVLDLLNGITVHGVAGLRDTYRPIRSQLTESIDPSVLLKCLDDVSGSGTAYLADLDAIQGGELNRCVLAELSRLNVSLMVDAGIRSAGDVEDLLDLGIAQAVVGLESLPGPEVAAQLLAAFPTESLVLSLDLKSGSLLSAHEPWAAKNPMDVLPELAEIGFRQWIILDLSTVGTGEGVPTEDLCRRWRELRPHDRIITGGGIRNAADLEPLSAAGVDGALIASALHNGVITADDCRRWQESHEG